MAKQHINIFISYSHKDEAYKDKFLRFLNPLKSIGILEYWEASQILIGTEYDVEIIDKINKAQIFLLLVSADSIASEYINQKELYKAFQKHSKGEIVIVPIILKPCNWEFLTLKQFHAVPKGGKAISLFENEDLAFKTVVEEIEKLVTNILAEKIIVNEAKTEKAVSPRKNKQSKKIIIKYGKVEAGTFFGNVDNVTIKNLKRKKKK